MKNKTYNSKTSSTIAFCSMMTALGTVIMLGGGLVPVFTYCSPLIAALLFIPICDRCGTLYAFMVWAATSFLSLLIGFDKEASFFYLFFGFYPIIKPWIDRLPTRFLRVLSKTALFTALTCTMYSLVCFVLKIDEIIGSFSESRILNLVFLAAIVLCLLIYDRALKNLSAYYHYKLKPKLMKNSEKRE